MISSQSVRSIGLGLCLAAFLMASDLSIYGLQYLVQNSPLSAFEATFQATPNSLFGSINITSMLRVAWVAFCLGVGFFAAGIIVPFVEAVVRFIFRIPEEIINFIGTIVWLRRKNLKANRDTRGGREVEFSAE